MDAVTYPDDETQRFLAERVVAVKPQIDRHPELAKRFGVAWTPGLVWLTPRGVPCHRNVGFFEPEELRAECLLGCAHAAAAESDWETALERFRETARLFPESHAAPAALYWAGVSAKKATGEAGALLALWKELLVEHPGSAWAMKVSFIENGGAS